MVGALRFLPIFLIGLTSAQCPTPCSMTKVFNVDEMCGPDGDQFRCGGVWRLQTPDPHPRCTQVRNGQLVNVCMYRREEDNKEMCFCDPGNCKYKEYQHSVPIEDCKRDCTTNSHIKMDCSITLTLSQMYTDVHSPIRSADGFSRPVLVYNEQLPGPTLTVCEGDNVHVKLINNLQGNDPTLLGHNRGEDPHLPLNSTTLHFHGIREWQKSSCHDGWTKGGPWSDGVPMVTQCPILSLESFTYTFMGSGSINSHYNNAPAGTYWYHSHVGTQRLNGAAGKLIIMPRKKRTDVTIDVDEPEYSLFLQEWYNTTEDKIPTSLLVNGKGKQNPFHHACTFPAFDCITKHKEGESVTFTPFTNPNYDPILQPNYEVFHVNTDTSYRFRIIGGIGDNHPIRLSIEDHKFTAIATDSIDIRPVHNLDALWIAGGERYDIVIKTKSTPQSGDPYKINVFTNINVKNIPLCSLAWLKYPLQTVDTGYEADCVHMESLLFTKVLNPVPNNFSHWGTPQYVYPNELRALAQAHAVNTELNTQYMSMLGLTFNNFTMKYPDIPFLFQSPSNNTNRCGVKCSPTHVGGTLSTVCTTNSATCGPQYPPNTRCDCQHVIQQPWSNTGNYWFEIIIISGPGTTAHPIHHHGGWFNIVGMGQFPEPKTRQEIMDMDTAGGGLPRNFNLPVFKDSIQVPSNGYVIFRSPIDNAGSWIVHCHINAHIERGMAMVFQIGEPDGSHKWSMGPDLATATENKNHKCF